MVKRIWNYPGVFIAWGLANGELGDVTQFVMKMHDIGIRWFALEVPQEAQGKSLDDQCVQLRAALRQVGGCYFGIWQDLGIDGGLHFAESLIPNFFIANVEGPIAQMRGLSFIPPFRTRFPKLPAAIITNFGGIDEKAQAAPWIKAGFACIPEAYVNANLQAVPAAVIFEAIRRGWKEEDCFPCFGVWGGYDLSKYGVWLNYYRDRGYSIYLAEGM